MLTVQLAAELQDAGIKVDSAGPGFTATDSNARIVSDHTGEPRRPSVSPFVPDDGPTGGFFSASDPQPWSRVHLHTEACRRSTCGMPRPLES
jgi:NAD(P)-dependent dehydrogenase (short-subunit alcohol dehydrogenase family)